MRGNHAGKLWANLGILSRLDKKWIKGARFVSAGEKLIVLL